MTACLTATIVVVAMLFSACRSSAPSGPGPEGIELEGMASWYGAEFAGRPTANGEIFDPQTMTAAHRTLPFGTVVDVTNLKNGRTTRVRINDRGPFVGNRIIDLSYAAARSLGMVEDGVSKVRLEIVTVGRGDREPPEPYSVTIDSSGTRPVPEVEPDVPSPEPVRTIDEEPAVVTSEPIEPTPPPAPTPVQSAATPAAPPPSQSVQPQNPPPPPSPPPAPATPASAERGWKVQVGAFGVEDNARRLAVELGRAMQGVYVKQVSGLFRVRVGPFDTRSAAIDAREHLNSLGYDAIVLSPEAK